MHLPPRRTGAIVGGVLGAAAFLGLTAYVVSAVMDHKLAGQLKNAPTTAAVPASPSPVVETRSSQELAAAQRTLGDALLKLNAQAPASTVPTSVSTPAVAPAPLAERAPSPAPAVVTQQKQASVPAPSADDVAKMLLRALSLVRDGQVASARSLLELASRSNDPKAAFALAETYDPKTLARWGAIGIAGNAERARTLYKQALDGGIEDARGRLGQLDR